MPAKLWELEFTLRDATDLLKRAHNLTATFLTDPHTGETLPWVEMGAVQERIGQALTALENACAPIQPAIDREREDDEHYADLADGRSL